MSDAVLADLFRALHVAVLERQPNHTFHLLTPAPAWLADAFGSAAPGDRQALAGALPFLDDFLKQADGAWDAGPHASIVSGPFAATIEGEELLIRATALTIAGRALLVLERLVGAADTRPMLQKARRHLLEQEQMTKQIARLHPPTARLRALVTELRSTNAPADLGPIIEGLEAACDHLHEALAPLPAPPVAPPKRH